MPKTQEAFLEAFFAVDQNNNEVLTYNDLETYAKRNHLSMQFPEIFLHNFGAEKNGTITLDQYCQKLGLITDYARDYAQRRITRQLFNEGPYPASVRQDVDIKFDNTKEEYKQLIFTLLLPALTNRDPYVDQCALDDALHEVKKKLELRAGKHWQLVVVKGHHVSRIGHLPNTLLHFSYHGFTVLVWQTLST